MNDYLEVKKLNYGRIVKISFYVSTLSKKITHYAIFLGFKMTRQLSYLVDKLHYTEDREADICRLIFDNSYIMQPMAIFIGASPLDLSVIEIKQLAAMTLAKQIKPDDLLSCKALALSMLDCEDIIIPEDTLNVYMTKNEMMSDTVFPDIVDIKTLYTNLEKLYEKNEVNYINITNLTKTGKYNQYKPLHFYILRSDKVLRLYYCMCPAERKGEFVFLLLYNGKPNSSWKSDIEQILRQSKNPEFVRNTKKTQLRIMSDKELWEINDLEAVPQHLEFSMYRTIKTTYCRGTNTSKYVYTK